MLLFLALFLVGCSNSLVDNDILKKHEIYYKKSTGYKTVFDLWETTNKNATSKERIEYIKQLIEIQEKINKTWDGN